MAKSVLLCALVGACLCLGVNVNSTVQLGVGRTVRNAIKRGEAHRYIADIPAGHCASVLLRQMGIDTWLRAYSPSGTVVLDLNWEDWGEERYSVCSEVTGPYKLEVQASVEDSNEGTYALTLLELNPRSIGHPDPMEAQDIVASAIRSRTDTESLIRAIESFQQQSNRWAEMKVRSHLARAHHRKGEYGPTVEQQTRALNLARSLGDRFEEAISMRELYRVYGHIGEQNKRLESRRDAIILLRSLGDPRSTVAAEKFVARPLREERRYTEALTHYHHLLGTYRAIGLRQESRDTLGEIALLESDLGQTESAVRTIMEYLEESKSTGVTRDQAAGHFRAGQILMDAGRLADAESHFESAAVLNRATDDKSAESTAHAAIADTAFCRGDLHKALRHIDWAIRDWDEVKASAGSVKWRAGLENGVRLRFKVRLLMALHRLEPSAGYDRRAVETCDGMRASYLGVANSTIHDMQMLAGDRSVMLVFFAAPQRSFLWALDGEAVRSFELPGEEVLQPLVEQYQSAVVARNRRVASDSAEQNAHRIAGADKSLARLGNELGNLLLSPLAPFLRDRKLVIVADGPLEQLSFASLRDPIDPAGRPIGHVRELTYLPSAGTVLALHRQRVDAPPLFTRELAVLADPVFLKNDPRLRPSSTQFGIPDTLRAATRAIGLGEIPRLLYSRIEGETVARCARNPMKFFDFDASRETFLSGRLNRVRVLHFAAHGFSNSDDPDLSGLVLSLVGRDGRPRDGFLQFQDVYNSQIGADLVVLSACQTAIGKSFKESGMMTLSGAFLHAGASRVLSTLWKIDDAATAELMRIFYRELLGNSRTPSSALRIAQTELAQNPRWKSPYYWGAFTLRGWPY